jgi:hypothetical protein
MRRRTKSKRKFWRFTEEFLNDTGIDQVRKMICAYDKGYVGLRKTIRVGHIGDSFVRNEIGVMVTMMKAPRLVAPKVRRKNKLSNRKFKHLRHEKTDNRW